MVRETASMVSIVACCHGAKLCAHAARDFRSQHIPLFARTSLVFYIFSDLFDFIKILTDISLLSEMWNLSWKKWPKSFISFQKKCFNFFNWCEARLCLAVSGYVSKIEIESLLHFLSYFTQKREQLIDIWISNFASEHYKLFFLGIKW